MNLVACGSIGCISQCTLNCLKKSSLILKKTVELSNADDVVNKNKILTTSILSESSIEHSFGSNRQKSQVESLTAEEYMQSWRKTQMKYILQSCQTPFKFLANIHKSYAKPRASTTPVKSIKTVPKQEQVNSTRRARYFSC